MDYDGCLPVRVALKGVKMSDEKEDAIYRLNEIICQVKQEGYEFLVKDLEIVLSMVEKYMD